MEEHLRKKQKTENCEHRDGEDGPWREQGLVLVSDRVEEEKHQLLDQQGDANTVDCAAVNVLVDHNRELAAVSPEYFAYTDSPRR